jgi:hypothetical protein
MSGLDADEAADEDDAPHQSRFFTPAREPLTAEESRRRMLAAPRAESRLSHRGISTQAQMATIAR